MRDDISRCEPLWGPQSRKKARACRRRRKCRRSHRGALEASASKCQRIAEFSRQPVEQEHEAVRTGKGDFHVVDQTARRLAAATAEIGVATADLYPTIHLVGLYGGAASQLSQLNTNIGRTWGLGPSINWTFPNQAGPRARVQQPKAAQAAALASFDSVVISALKDTEQALAQYGAALDNRQSLADAQEKIHEAFAMAHDQFWPAR